MTSLCCRWSILISGDWWKEKPAPLFANRGTGFPRWLVSCKFSLKFKCFNPVRIITDYVQVQLPCQSSRLGLLAGPFVDVGDFASIAYDTKIFTPVGDFLIF